MKVLPNLRKIVSILLTIAIIAIGIRESYVRGHDAGYKSGFNQGIKTNPLVPSSEDTKASEAFTKENFLAKINATRAAVNLSTLPLDSKLASLAQTDVVAVCGKIKDPNFKLDASQNKFTGYNFYGEIVSEDTPTPIAVINEWMHNPNHQPILLRPDFNQIGIGVTGTCVAVIFGNK